MKPTLDDVQATAKNDEASLVAQIAQLNGALMYVRQFQNYLKTDKPEPKPSPTGEGEAPEGAQGN